MKPTIIVILGPTASGKTRLAAHLAHILQTEIISADSRQVYCDMNIGTGKDYAEYLIDGQKIPTHLIDIKQAGERYHIDEFRKDFFVAYEHICAEGKTPILCGGTGLYIDSVLRNFEYTSVPVDSELRGKLLTHTREELLEMFSQMPTTTYKSLADTTTVKRLVRAIEINTFLQTNTFVPKIYPTLRPIVLGLDLPVTIRRENIAQRLQQRLQHGLIEEVQQLRAIISDDQLEYYGLEYKFVTWHLQGKISFIELQQKLTTAIQQFAKRQMTYFRKMERDGLPLYWMDATLPINEQLQIAEKLIVGNTD